MGDLKRIVSAWFECVMRRARGNVFEDNESADEVERILYSFFGASSVIRHALTDGYYLLI